MTIKQKTLMLGVFFFTLSTFCHGSYFIHVKNQQISKSKSPQNFYKPFHGEFNTNINFIVSPAGKFNKAFFICLSKGGITEKNENQFLTQYNTKKTRDESIAQLSYNRKLQNGPHTLSYNIYSQRENLMPITQQKDIGSIDNVYQFYAEDFNKHLPLLSDSLVLKIPDLQTPIPGIYTDVLTVYIYEGIYTDSKPKLLFTQQFKLSVTVPKTAKLEHHDLEYIKTTDTHAIFTLHTNISSNTPYEINIKEQRPTQNHIDVVTYEKNTYKKKNDTFSIPKKGKKSRGYANQVNVSLHSKLDNNQAIIPQYQVSLSPL